MERRKFIGDATNMMLSFAKDTKLAKYMTETSFQDGHAQWKKTTPPPPKPALKKQYSEKELEEVVNAQIAQFFDAQKKGTDFPGYLGRQSTFDKTKKQRKRVRFDKVPISSSSSSDSSSNLSEEDRKGKKRSKKQRFRKGKKKAKKTKSRQVNDSSTEDTSSETSNSEDGKFYANKKNFYKANPYDFLEDKSKKVREFKEKFSSSFHPHTDGQSEIANSMVLELLKSYISDQETQWEKYLPLVEFAYNNTTHSLTGKAPFEIVEGDVPDDGEPDEQPEVEENEEILVPEQILAHKDKKNKGTYGTSDGKCQWPRGANDPFTVPTLQTIPYDNLEAPEKPKAYKEGGATVKFETFNGFEDKTKPLTFLQQFDTAYAGGSFTEASKVKKAATFLKGNVLTWWMTLLMQGQEPTTWVYFNQMFASAWLSNEFEADVGSN
ncbi:hypothetical protein L7F22_033374 [Adiantum nelumboides]|nr:hypothetical protein [Adiantum nelumboides]